MHFGLTLESVLQRGKRIPFALGEFGFAAPIRGLFQQSVQTKVGQM